MGKGAAACRRSFSRSRARLELQERCTTWMRSGVGSRGPYALERLALLGGTCTIADKRLLVQLPTGEVRHDGLGGGPGFSLRLAA